MSESRSSFPVTTSSAIPGQSSSHVSLVASGNAVSTSSSAGAVSSASASASAPLGATVDESAPHLTRRRSSSVGQHPEDAYPPPMTITGSINEDGLGAVSWWDGSDGDRDEEVAPEESMIES